MQRSRLTEVISLTTQPDSASRRSRPLPNADAWPMQRFVAAVTCVSLTERSDGLPQTSHAEFLFDRVTVRKVADIRCTIGKLLSVLPIGLSDD